MKAVFDSKLTKNNNYAKYKIISGCECRVSALLFELDKNIKTKQKSKVKINGIEIYIISKPNEEQSEIICLVKN
ncbi:MAG: hypothetical protein LBF33_03535 [Oscillospiraceae bacterium]|jgi:hypothetical protein|nr:hypothetical protein [Oscillospiraceae bacterium]